jgi:glycosyltransferase involved in cell wall biosynthesis
MYIAYNRFDVIVAVSAKPFEIEDCTTIFIDADATKLVGKQLKALYPKKPHHKLKVACICNWNDACGISTYTRFLMDTITKKVAEVKIFSEHNDHPTSPDDDRVIRCWKRGQSMRNCMDQVKAWKPDFVIVQHEFGIFPRANYFLQMLHMLENIPYAICLHSVYEHLDKTICTSAAKNLIVHTQTGKKCLQQLGHNQPIFIIPHGCIQYENTTELWNIFQSPYTLIQFGFGFFYKGVDRAIDAVHLLKTTDPKFKDIFYVYLCSDSGHFDSVHSQYYHFLNDKIEKLNLQDNVSIIRKFHTEQTINNYLRTAKIALFPYSTDPKHVVYGASGAIRVAMANEIPTIASESHMFDDLEGILPRPTNAQELAKEIDEIFSNDKYKSMLLNKIDQHIKDNTWDVAADKYLEVYYAI